MDTMTTLAVVLVAVLACVTDLRSRRIPNALTLSAALAGLLAHWIVQGPDGALFSASGWLVGLLVFLPFFLVRGMGGGDVKLMAALGAWLGPQETIWLAIYTGIAGGVLAVLVAASSGYLRTALHNVLSVFRFWAAAGIRPVPGITLESKESPRLAYAVPIFAGVVVTIWL
jgi:prepilin peptidase CpaA